QTPASTHAFHSPTLTSYFASANGARSVTLCAGFSLGSLELLPMMNVPAGSASMTGQAAQSLTEATGPASAMPPGSAGAGTAGAGRGLAGGGLAAGAGLAGSC